MDPGAIRRHTQGGQTPTAKERWPPGTTVAVATLGSRKGTVVSGDGRGRYRVRVNGIVVSCRESDLSEVTNSRKRAARRKPQAEPDVLGAREAHTGRAGSGRRGGRISRIDLHGMRIEEALARVDDAIDRALLEDADGLEIVHGKGTGRIREALHRHLTSMSVVAAFRLDPANSGVTWVHF